MLDFQLKIYLGLYDKAVEKVVKEAPLPEAVQAEIFLFSDYKNNIPENVTAVFITDKISLLRSALALRKKNLRIVYCGHAEDVGKLLNKLEALWPAGEKTEIIKKRFMILIKNLKNEFYAWFYQNALLTTINSLPDMFWYQRIDGVHTLVNDTFAETVHKPKTEIYGKKYSDIWDIPRPEKAGEETAVKTCDGRKQFITYQSPVYDMYGNLFGTVGISRDVTNSSDTGTDLSALVENLPFPLLILSADWKVVRMNRAFEKLFGYKAQDAENFDYQNWKKENMTSVNDETSKQETRSEIQKYYIQCNADTKQLIAREQEICDAFNNVSGYFLIVQEIT